MWHSPLQYMALSLSSITLPLSNHLLLSNLLLSEPTTHGPHHWLISTSLAVIHDVFHNLGLIHSPYNCGEKMWNEGESKTNEVLKGDKVPLGDNRSATHGNCT